MNKVSVIIPIYNAELYIGRCIDSILNQTLKELEIICVNDGSTDNSLKICEAYAEHEDRVRVFNKENGGAPSARNVGLKYADGEYITFVDVDDWIEPAMYEKLYSQAVEEAADISVIGFTKDTDNVSIKMENEAEIPGVIETSEQMIRYAFIRDRYRNFGAYVWNKLFKRELLFEKNVILYDESLTRGDDVLFYAQAALKAGRAVYSEECLYHYIQRTTSYTKAISLIRGEGILRAYEQVVSLCQEAGMSEETICYLKRFYVYHASLLAEKAIRCSNMEKLAEYKVNMRKYLSEYLDTNVQYPERIERIENLLNYE